MPGVRIPLSPLIFVLLNENQMAKEKHYRFKLTLDFTVEACSDEEAEERGLECAQDIIGDGLFDLCKIKVSLMTPEELKIMRGKERIKAREMQIKSDKQRAIAAQKEKERLKNGIQPVIGKKVLEKMGVVK